MMAGLGFFIPMKLTRIIKTPSKIDPSVIYHLRPWNERRRLKAIAKVTEPSGRIEDLSREELAIDRKHEIPLEIEEAKSYLATTGVSDEEIRQHEEALIEADSTLKSADMRDLRLLNVARQRAVAGMSDDERNERNRERARLTGEMNRINHEEIRPVWFEMGVVRIEGVTDEDDKPVETVKDFTEDAPQELLDELYLLVLRGAQLIGDEPGNSDSPSTSGVAEDGEKTDSTAPSAS